MYEDECLNQVLPFYYYEAFPNLMKVSLYLLFYKLGKSSCSDGLQIFLLEDPVKVWKACTLSPSTFLSVHLIFCLIKF